MLRWRGRNSTVSGLISCLVIICVAALVACSCSSQRNTHLAGPGVELPGSQIPWDQVGPGWILATWGQPQDASGDPSKVLVTLYLFDPAGGRYAITNFSPWPATGPGLPGVTPLLADWSGDGKHALFEDLYEVGGHTTMVEVDLTNGAKQTLTVEGDATGAYTRPTGQAIFLAASKFNTPGSCCSGGYTNTLTRVDLDGIKQLTLPTDRLGAAGKFSGDYLQTPDGSQLVLAGDKGMVVMGNDGTIVRQLPTPAPGLSCRPARWWTSTVVLAACAKPPNVDPETQLWQVPLAGGTSTALTPAGSKGLGYLDAWQVPSGTFLEDVPGCGGDGQLFRMTLDMKVTKVTVPGVDSKKAVRVVGVTGDKLLLRASGGCGSHNISLWIYDPAANTATVLPSPPGNVDVKRAILYPNS